MAHVLIYIRLVFCQRRSWWLRVRIIHHLSKHSAEDSYHYNISVSGWLELLCNQKRNQFIRIIFPRHPPMLEKSTPSFPSLSCTSLHTYHSLSCSLGDEAQKDNSGKASRSESHHIAPSFINVSQRTYKLDFAVFVYNTMCWLLNKYSYIPPFSTCYSCRLKTSPQESK